VNQVHFFRAGSSAESRTALFSTSVIPDGMQITIRPLKDGVIADFDAADT